jgi:ABC-2 type transport system permease protein
MILPILQTGFRALRRDRAAFVLSFIVPIAFFTIFGIIFGGQHMDVTPKVNVIVVDEDRSPASRRLVRGLLRESSLNAFTSPWHRKGEPARPDYTAAAAEVAVKDGTAPAAIIIPAGFGAHPIAFGPGNGAAGAIQILHDSSDPVAAPLVSGMLQKTLMTAMPDVLAGEGMNYFETAAGGLTPEQRERVKRQLADLRAQEASEGAAGASVGAGGSQPAGRGSLGISGFMNLKVRDVVGERKQSPMIAYYAAGIGVMFLLFSASAAGGTLLDEAESGALDRVLSSRVSMTTFLVGKLAYSAIQAALQLTVMFVWGALVFHLDLLHHVPGFIVMTAATSFAVAAFGMLLAAISHTRAQQAAVGTLLILIMSAVGGSMFPQFLMPPIMLKLGKLTFNSWAIDGFTRVFWRDESVVHLAGPVAALLCGGLALFLLARRFARRWEHT